MGKYKINCQCCQIKIDMVNPTRPLACPSCGNLLGFFNVIEVVVPDSSGVIDISNNFSTGGKQYIKADGDCDVHSKNDVVLGFETVVTAKNGARVRMDDAVVEKAPDSIYISIFKKIITELEKVGQGRVINMEEDELISFFTVVQNRIHSNLVEGVNVGAFTGIRALSSPTDGKSPIIGLDNSLTKEGARLIKDIAMEMET